MKKYLVLSASIFALSVSMPAFADDTVNNSSIDQIGTALSLTLTQTGDRNHNTAGIEQGLLAPSDTMTSTVLQTGEDTTNETKLKQDGFGESATVEQRGLGFTTNFAAILQDGSANTVQVLQNGTGNANDALLTQHGTGTPNMIDLKQGGTGSINNSTTTQTGGGLTATIVQN